MTFLGHLAQSWNSHGPNTPLGGSTGRAFEKGPPRPSIVPGREKRLGSHYRRPGVKSRNHRTKVSLPCESPGRGTGPARPGLLRKDAVRERASRVLVPYPRARHRRFLPEAAALHAVPGGRSSTSTSARRGKASQEVTLLGHPAQSWKFGGQRFPLGGSTGRAFEKGPLRPSIVPGRGKRFGSHYRRPGVKSRNLERKSASRASRLAEGRALPVPGHSVRTPCEKGPAAS